jgi:hypothetical protein
MERTKGKKQQKIIILRAHIQSGEILYECMTKTRPESGSLPSLCHPSLFWKILKNTCSHTQFIIWAFFCSAEWIWVSVYVIKCVRPRSEPTKHWNIQQSSCSCVQSVRNTTQKGRECAVQARLMCGRGKESAWKNRWNHRKITNECFTKMGVAKQYIFI